MIYVFDLDGTLCQTDGRNYLEAVPYPERIAHVNALYDAGNVIIIDTARGSGTGEQWQHRTAVQLNGWGLQYHELRAGVKKFGDIYVDDRAHNAADYFHA